MKDYFGNYLGIVVQNDDPEKRGRVKIFVPHISATIYENWNQDKQDKAFKFMGKENEDLDKISTVLKDSLPWAECAAPLFGGCASGRYNAYNNTGTTSDSNYWESTVITKGNRALQNYTKNNPYPDAFTSTGENNNRLSNEYAYEYTPSNYTNLARGLFTIPNVGSHVWLFFRGGDPNDPVYFAVSYGQEDWKRIYTTAQSEDEEGSTDYPASYENITRNESSFNDDISTFRSKTVFNSNKHSIELVDTDSREILKMTHFSGSFKEFNNYANIELATNNDQKLVIGDQFLTVRKNQGLYVAMNQETIVEGDRFKRVGSGERETVQTIVDILKEIHAYKLLFDIQRTNANIIITTQGAVAATPNAMSPLQLQVPDTQQGTKLGYAPCPVCGGIPYTPNFGPIQPPNPYLPQINFDDVLNGTDPNVESDALGSFPSSIGGIGIVAGNICDTCKGTGYSPSTQDGYWVADILKQSRLPQLILQRSSDLASLERKLGEGDEIIDITKNKIETIGLVMNDMQSYRIDPIGKIRIDGSVVAPEDVYTTYKTSPHVEYVDVDDVPGGDYNLTCTNKFKLLVGAKGVNIKTYGPIDIYGTIVNMIGEQVNISSQNEVFIDGGERFSIRARKVSFHPFEHAPVAIDGQLHVARNMIVGGGAMIDGELGVNHMTAPYDFRTTEPYYGLEQPIVTLPGPGLITHTHVVPPHTHYYKHISSTLLPAQEAVRDSMITNGINSLTTLAAAGALSPGGTAASGDLGGLSYSNYESLVGGPSDDVARSQSYVADNAVGRTGGGTGNAITQIGSGGNVTYTIYYNYRGTDGKQHNNGMSVSTVVNVNSETGGGSVVSGPSATRIN